jgi:hypothetical protein
MGTRQVADDIWLVEQKTAKKTAYVGMIRQISDYSYKVIKGGIVYEPFETLEEAEKFFET